VALADLAAGQWGLFTAPQAQHAGVSRVRLSRLTQAGVLVRLAHGTYALRGATSADRLELRAAWLGLDPTRLANDRLDDGAARAVVSHASAADLYGLGDLDADRHEFTTPSRKQSRRPDVRLHRGVLDAGDVTLHDGLPVTTPERVVVDLLAAGHDGEHVAGVLASAVRDRRVNLSRLAPRLTPFSARLGLPSRDGRRLLEHLLELGGVTELIAAERLAEAARASNRTIGDLLDSTVNTRASEIAASILQDPDVRDALRIQTTQIQELIASAFPAPTTMIDTNLAAIVQSQLPTINPAILQQSEQLAAVMAALPRSQLAEAAALHRNYSTQSTETMAALMRQARETRT